MNFAIPQSITGVYEIRCTANGKTYIGSAAVSVRRRWNNHRRKLRNGVHENSYLQLAWKKHGEHSFEFLILEQCAPDDCLAREQFWIDEKRATDRSVGFNLSPSAGSSLGFRHSEEAKAKVSAFFRGRKLSAETRAKLSAAHANPSPEYRAKMSAAKRGETRSPETRAKMSIAKRGTKASAETRARIGAASRGRKHSEEAKAKMSEALRKRYAEIRAEIGSIPKPCSAYQEKANCVICGREYDKVTGGQMSCSEACGRKRTAQRRKIKKAESGAHPTSLRGTSFFPFMEEPQ